jgi:hypothetical protein
MALAKRDHTRPVLVVRPAPALAGHEFHMRRLDARDWIANRRGEMDDGEMMARALAAIDDSTLPDDAELAESPPLEDALEAVRKHRNALLFSCDWTQLPDAPLSTSQKGAWRQYRQSLRDMMATLVWNQSTWPAPPDDSMENSPVLD